MASPLFWAVEVMLGWLIREEEEGEAGESYFSLGWAQHTVVLLLFIIIIMTACLLALDKTALLLYHLCFFATNYMNYLPLLSLGLTQILLYSIKISHFIHILSIQILLCKPLQLEEKVSNSVIYIEILTFPLVSWFQAILFYVPRWLWKNWEAGKIHALMMDLDIGVVQDVEKRQKKRLLLDYLADNLKHHNWWAYRYFFCEFLALVNIIGKNSSSNNKLIWIIYKPCTTCICVECSSTYLAPLSTIFNLKPFIGLSKARVAGDGSFFISNIT